MADSVVVGGPQHLSVRKVIIHACLIVKMKISMAEMNENLQLKTKWKSAVFVL